MQLMGRLNAANIELDLPASNKHAVLVAMSDQLSRGAGVNRSKILQALVARERLGSTAINHGVALPHARSDAVTSPNVALTRLERPIDFGAIDGASVDLVFGVIWPAQSIGGFVAPLAWFCRLLREPCLLRGLRDAPTHREARILLCIAAKQAASAGKRTDLKR